MRNRFIEAQRRRTPDKRWRRQVVVTPQAIFQHVMLHGGKRKSVLPDDVAASLRDFIAEKGPA
jgi:ribosomal protein S19